MTDQFRFGTFFCLILVVCVFFAGCSGESTSTAGNTVPTTSTVALFSPGDIIAKTASGGEMQLYVITNYDAARDEYERAWIYKNTDGSWGHFLDSRTDRSTRKIIEKVYPVKVAHVSVSGIPVITPALVTAGPTISTGVSPVVSNITPSSAAKDATVTVTITGKNFQTGAVPKLVSPGYVPVTGSAVSVTSTLITCTFILKGIDTGSANIIVYNPDGRSDTLQNAFIIGEVSPIISSIYPNTAAMNDTQTSYTVYGQNFKSPVLISFLKGPAEIVCLSPSVIDSTKITCGAVSFSLKNSATVGTWDVRIINVESSKSGILSQKFTVTVDPATTTTSSS
jgi:hypothetical protein